MQKKILFFILALCLPELSALAFNGHLVKEPPLTLFISDPGLVTNFAPQTLDVRLTNSGPAALAVKLRLELIDGCQPSGETAKQIAVPANGSASATFAFTMAADSYSALYPVHVFAAFEAAGLDKPAHAVRIFETDFSVLREAARTQKPVAVHRVVAGGTLPLTKIKDARVRWQQFGSPEQVLPPGWQGSERDSGTSFAVGPAERGGTKPALTVHPPWRKGAGTMFLEYSLQLPQSPRLQLLFSNAIRDNVPPEPPSDGVTFRVWVGNEKLFERHTAAKQWEPGSADLSKFAGQQILLRLESDPGPKRDTTCDSGYWGDPVVTAGDPPPQLTDAARQDLQNRATAAVRAGKGDGTTFIFDLTGGYRAVVVPGPNGIADAALAFGSSAGAITFEGFQVAVDDELLGNWPAGRAVRKATASRDESGKLTIAHQIATDAGTQPVTVELWAENAGLRLKVSSAARISDLALGRADRKASRVYYGHGYCVVEPGTFRAGGGGHNLSTSHVGFEFADGPALLMACDTPPDDFQVDPGQRLYTLHTHPDTLFTFVPGSTALQCALAYRPLYDKRPAPAFQRKAGRFVFDLWGGRYADNAARLRRCFSYGLTNSLVLIHDWQRWGYDYRLPDVFPPAPNLGTAEDLRELGRVCAEAGALWGLHDNYIDIYPDATGFSYDHVTFDAQGRPKKAWLNEGRQAQSYQFRPDHVRPFLERNVRQIAPALQPTASFVDVWTSINAFDYFDRTGTFHSKMETLLCWGQGFATLRDNFGHGPTTSEAGSDQLIGWLDGADCQFLQIGPRGERFQLTVPCREWERVPWFDAVNHTRFSLHGVGYSDRYQGGRSRDLHGIESDDYISAELLTGHALMIDHPAGVRGAVRKYWLAQDFIDSIATGEIRSVEFVDDDIHRQLVTWDSGAKVYVNRGSNDWAIAGRLLPPYGYFATNGTISSSIERLGTSVVEQSQAPGRFYFDGRGFNPNAPLPIRPEAGRVEYLGGRNFRLEVNWQADTPAPRNLAVFYHFNRPTPGRYTDTEFVGGGRPDPVTSTWKGTITTGRNWTVTIPENVPPGDYDVLVGLYDAAGDGRRYRLVGDEDPHRRYRLGKLHVEGSQVDGKLQVLDVRLEKESQRPPMQLTVNRDPTDFGPAQTKGALRLLVSQSAVRVIPLPDSEPFEIRLDLARIATGTAKAAAVRAINAKGVPGETVQYRQSNSRVQFTTRKDDFGYEIELKPD